MLNKSIFQIVSEAINKTGISCVLIGGYAVNFYKYSRQTADVDFLITKESFNEILSLLEASGYKKDFVQDAFVRLKSDNLSFMDIDFMFVDKSTFEKIIKDGREVELAKYKFIIPSLNNLIALKLHSLKSNFKQRQLKDIPDIVALVNINKIDVRGKDFKELCLQYGNDVIYDKILGYA